MLLLGKDLLRAEVFGLNAHIEQPPRPENRITLARDRESWGFNRPRLHWRLGEAEEAAVVQTLALVSQDLEDADIGSVRSWVEPGRLTRLIRHAHHHMGTTRMHPDPKHGVVDEDCRVHGLSNLFVAGSSVLPTGGACTVTLTLVALAIRLADHLKARLPQATLRI